MKMKYERTIEDVITLAITDSNLAVVTDNDSKITVRVQLANDEEASKMIAEFEDGDGELMHAEGAVFGKYEELHQFKP